MKRLYIHFWMLMLCLTLHPLYANAQTTEMEQGIFDDMREGDKAVVVAVHEGADNALARKSIERFNNRLRAAYPNRDFCEAWTSRTLIRQQASDGVTLIPTPDELFSQLQKKGYTHVLIQSSDIVDGANMQYLRHAVEATRGHFRQIRLGQPLLADVADYNNTLTATTTVCGQPKEANVLLCDGATQTGCSQYAMLDYTLQDKDLNNWFVGTSGDFLSFESLLHRLKKHKAKKVTLVPFVFAADTQSNTTTLSQWAEKLKRAGFKVTTYTHGLSDIDAIIDIFIDHTRHAEHFRTYTARELRMLTR